MALLLSAIAGGSAQQVGIKTNLLYDAALSPNLGIEIQTAPRWSFDLSGNLNAWTVKGHKWKHWLVQPEMRYWLCEGFAGHFFAVHALAGQYRLLEAERQALSGMVCRSRHSLRILLDTRAALEHRG